MQEWSLCCESTHHIDLSNCGLVSPDLSSLLPMGIMLFLVNPHFCIQNTMEIFDAWAKVLKVQNLLSLWQHTSHKDILAVSDG